MAPLHDRLSHYWIGEAVHKDPLGAAGRCFMCDLSRSWKTTGMSWAANKVSSIDPGWDMVTCLAQRLMGNNRLARWDLVSSMVSVAGCCFSSYCHSDWSVRKVEAVDSQSASSYRRSITQNWESFNVVFLGGCFSCFSYSADRIRCEKQIINVEKRHKKSNNNLNK